MSETRSPGRSAVVLLRRAVEMERAAWHSMYLYADDADGFPRSRRVASAA
jgi:hypothetical protein